MAVSNYTITVYDDGFGAVDVYRFGTNQENVTISAIPNPNYHFLKYSIVGLSTIEEVGILTENDEHLTNQNGEEFSAYIPIETEITEPSFTFTILRDAVVTAYFEEDDQFTISASTNFEYGSVFVSENIVYSGTTVTLWARPFPDRAFVKWSDGETANPRNIVVTTNLTLVAIYQRSTETNGVYQYRCFIKDQMHLTDYPKCFLKIDTFGVKRDLLTNANTTITTIEDIPEDVNEGDIVVLYDPKGITLYQGVIKTSGEKRITCSQMESFYKGTWIYNTHSSSSLEEEIAYLLNNYANGYIYRSSYRDTWVSQRLGGITIRHTASTSVHLPSDLNEDGEEQLTEYDMEKFIYELYETYGIVFRFTINVQGSNYVDIEVPSYDTIKVGNNMYAIKDLSPVTSIEETNRLIIFGQNKAYRTTYIATKNGIVENPTSSENRFNITNTSIVYSDDDASDLVASNLPQQMYNHKLTFTLMLKNFLFEFEDFNLGGSLDVWKDDDYYNTVLTGYEIKKESNKSIESVDFICGKVRIALTKQLTLKGGL